MRHIFVISDQQSLCFHGTPCLCGLVEVVKVAEALKWTYAVFLLLLHAHIIAWGLNYVFVGGNAW